MHSPSLGILTQAGDFPKEGMGTHSTKGFWLWRWLSQANIARIGCPITGSCQNCLYVDFTSNNKCMPSEFVWRQTILKNHINKKLHWMWQFEGALLELPRKEEAVNIKGKKGGGDCSFQIRTQTQKVSTHPPPSPRDDFLQSVPEWLEQKGHAHLCMFLDYSSGLTFWSLTYQKSNPS